jgi:predicted dinucleotide-binding enzyme
VKITIVGRGGVGGGLGGLWRRAGHDVTLLGRDGGDASGADVVVVAVPGASIDDALGRVRGLRGRPAIDTTNVLHREDASPSLAHRVKEHTAGPVAKAFNINFASLYDEIGEQRVRPSNLYATDPEMGDLVAGLIRDCGYDPVLVGDLSRARALEEHCHLVLAMARAGSGAFFYRIAAAGRL